MSAVAVTTQAASRPVDTHRMPSMPVQVRKLLIGFAAGDVDQPLSSSSVDWDALLSGIYRHGLVGLTHRYLEKGTSRNEFPEPFRDAVAAAFEVLEIHMASMYQWITDTTSALSEAGLDCLVLKGPALAHLVYPQPMLRTFGDLDLMVRERDMLRAHTTLKQLGFAPEVDIVTPPAKLTRACTTYEMRYLDRERGFLLELHYDDLLNAGLRSRDRDGYWDRRQMVRVGDQELETLSHEDLLIHLCCHMHFHGYTKLNWFSDLAFLVRDGGDRFDWDHVIRTAQKEEAQLPVSSSLGLLRQLLRISAPPAAMDVLTVDRFRRRMHAYYLPSERVLTFEPLPRPDFSFYFRPVFKRLIPDLLVMGRRREKLQILARLICPPARWLRDYYAVPPHRALWPHYLLHPLKLAWHLGRETAAIPRRRGPWWNSET